MRPINIDTLVTFGIAAEGAYKNALMGAPQGLDAIFAKRTPMSAPVEELPLALDAGSVREWKGDRQAIALEVGKLNLNAKLFEKTIAVARTAIEDGALERALEPMKALGMAVARYPEEQLTTLLANAESANGYDGVPFFSASHPVGTGTVANLTSGAQTPWYLVAAPTRAENALVPPLFIGEYVKPEFQSVTDLNDESIFKTDTFLYGIRARTAFNYGFWQGIHKSKATLDSTGLYTAFQAIAGRVNDKGAHLGLVPTHLVVPRSLQGSAEALIMAMTGASGATNVWYKRLELVVYDYGNF